MYLYRRFLNAFAVYVECTKDLGITPLFSFKSCKQETIFDLPFTQVILTSADRFKSEEVSLKESFNLKDLNVDNNARTEQYQSRTHEGAENHRALPLFSKHKL